MIPVKQKLWFTPDISRNSDSDVPTRTQSLKESENRARACEVIKSLLKNLTYDRKSNWQAFRMKFTRYAKCCEWTDDEAFSAGVKWAKHWTTMPSLVGEKRHFPTQHC